MKRLFVAITLTLLSGYAYSQTPVIQWQKCLGSFSGDYAYSVRQTTDGGYIVAGYTENAGGDITGYHGNVNIGDLWVVKLTANGNIEWQKCIGGFGLETGGYVFQTPDGGYIVAGSSTTTDCNITGNHGGTDFWLVKLSPIGDMQWQKMYGGSQNEYCYAFDVAPDGGYVMAGYSMSNDGDVGNNKGNTDYWVIKTDAGGNLLWQKNMGGSGEDIAVSVKGTADGGAVVNGYVESNDGDVSGNHGMRDYWVVKLGNGGNIQWQKCLGGTSRDMGTCVQTTADGGYIVAGESGSVDGDVSGNLNAPFADYWVAKLNSSGNIQWQKCYGGNQNDIPYSMQVTPDGGYVLAGFSTSNTRDVNCNAGIEDGWVIKINSTGTLEWQKDLGGNYFDDLFSIQPLADGSFITCGHTCSSDVEGRHPNTNGPNSTCGDFWVVKLTAPVVTPPAPTVSIQPASGFICAGGTATFTASAQYAGTNPVYRWTKNGVTVSSGSATYSASNFAANDVIACYVTSGGACDNGGLQGSSSVKVTLVPNNTQLQFNITASSTSICNCTPVTFKANVTNGSGAMVFQWLVNGVSTGYSADTYLTNLLKPGDVVSCIATDNAACIANGQVASNPITMVTGGAQTPSVQIAASTNSICAGSPVTFTATASNAGANPTYIWKVNGIVAGANSGTFTTTSLASGDVVNCSITIDPSFTCATASSAVSNTLSITVTDKLDPAVTIQTPATTICSGMPATFTAAAVNAGNNVVYQWLVNGANAGGNANSFTSSTLADGDIVSCTVTVDPSYTCANHATAASNNIAMTVINQPAPAIMVTASSNDVCAGALVTFTATATNTGANPSYQWMVNNTPANNTSTVFNTTALANGDVVYCVLTPGQGTCATTPVNSNTVAAIINEAPRVIITPADTAVTTGSVVQLNAQVTGSIGSFTWDPAGKLTNPSLLHTATIALTENVTYTLQVTSDKGCTAQAAAIVKVSRPLVMPNAFTPNNDGRNDVFRIPAGVLINVQEFSIFDRWGNRVFTTKDSGKGWDGTFNGKPANAGVYVYVIKGVAFNGAVLKKGEVVLVR